jgi:flagellin
MTINTNPAASASALQLSRSQDMLTRSLNKLSSGSRIVQPSDDAAGLAVSEKFSAQGKRINAALTNVQNAVSYVQTADGFMGGLSQVLSRMSELSMLAKDVTKNSDDIALYQKEFTALQQQVKDTVGGVGVTAPLGTFNSVPLFGPNPAGMTVTIGEGAGQTMSITETNLQDGDLGALLTQTGGVFDVKVTDVNIAAMVTDAIQDVAGERASLGAVQSRLELAISTLQVQGQVLEQATSRIRDVDVAQESTQFAKNNILVQSGTAMLAQANQLPQSILKLLQ